MKKLFFTLLLFIPILALAQENNVYKQTSEFAFHTIQKDTLYLDMSNYATPGIVKVWTEDTLYNQIKPVIIVLPNGEFWCILSEIESCIIWSYTSDRTVYSEYRINKKRKKSYETQNNSRFESK